MVYDSGNIQHPRHEIPMLQTRTVEPGTLGLLKYLMSMPEYADPVVFDKSVTWYLVKKKILAEIGKLM